MPTIQTVVQRLNLAVRCDWMGIQKMLNERVLTTPAMATHPTIIVRQFQTEAGQVFGVGLLGIINGLCRENHEDLPVEAVYTQTEPIELMGFALRGQQLERDQRLLSASELLVGHCYRIQDKLNNYWMGRAEVPAPGAEQAVYLRTPEGKLVQIFYHDVHQIVAFNHP